MAKIIYTHKEQREVKLSNVLQSVLFSTPMHIYQPGIPIRNKKLRNWELLFRNFCNNWVELYSWILKLKNCSEHIIQYTDDVLQNCSFENYIILLTNITTINSIEFFFDWKKIMDWVVGEESCRYQPWPLIFCRNKDSGMQHYFSCCFMHLYW